MPAMPLATDPGITIRQLPPCHLWSLRARAPDVERLSVAWGGGLDLAPLASASTGRRHALRLGPDEWLLIADSASAADGLHALAETIAFSIVDISAREIGWEIAGDHASRLLAGGCPLDLSDAHFPPGRATRTIYGQAEIVLWRPASERAWEVRALRSFTNYLTRHLAHAVHTLPVSSETR
jgi:sarcosine oxidase subunit gamma